jgi:hypothetical protein
MCSSAEESQSDMYLSIGSKVLEQVVLGEGRVSSENAVRRLTCLLDTPLHDLNANWDRDASEIVEEMAPCDFALHGRRLIQFLLRMSGPHWGAQNENAQLQQTMLTRRPLIGRDNRREFPKWLPTYDV